MWRDSGRAALVTASIALCGGCAASDAPLEGPLSSAASTVADPVAALEQGLAGLARLSEPVDGAEAERRVRRLLSLLSAEAFDRWPDARARLRVELVYVMNPPEPDDRAASLARARELVGAMR
jgi:hypothetical protein